ncbi:unnamed protein product [Ilex paraguariensis]|uniref:C2 domain-containing protein n=1 Tax=Ilex paraguariensis TaxID=185542 RepID=A0ABC8UNC5_9AQUA
MGESPTTPGAGVTTKCLMDNLMGLLRIRIKRGVNLAVRDVRSSDPYVVVKMGKQESHDVASFRLLRGISLMLDSVKRLKTRVIRKDVNPEWNEDLTLSIQNPNLPIKLKDAGYGGALITIFNKKDAGYGGALITIFNKTVYDHDTFTKDDKMGDAEFDIKAFLEALRMKLDGLPSGTVITRVQPSRTNYLAEESTVIWKDGRVMQDMCLRLRNVECGEVELGLHWIDLPGAKGF